ncbi:MAG: hypothetical protein M1832_003471 [Thelocarpon impressellum]|nr:MAG: hypothetical protein M1832_003471 [Thelocarpon impressellum]
MLLRKSGLLSPSYTGLHSLSVGHQLHTSSAPLDSRSPASESRQWGRRRGYAHVASDKDGDGLAWPETANPSAFPTPYQIFCQKKGSPYSKRRFYALVKLYHPDRQTGRLAPATKLERYRLVVAANDILSDPVRRSAYDRYGAGWNGCPEVSRSWAQNPSAYGNHSSGSWSKEHSPSQNATWEDWERWYERDAKRPQQPLFFANGAFVSLIVMLAALGGVGQATRAGNHAMTFLEERDRLHDETSRDLRRRRRETTAAEAHRDERIAAFLRSRDTGHGVEEVEEIYRRSLPASPTPPGAGDEDEDEDEDGR